MKERGRGSERDGGEEREKGRERNGLNENKAKRRRREMPTMGKDGRAVRDQEETESVKSSVQK